MLGAFLSFLAAVSFALNNATTRRGVIKGTVSQAMAITVPMGIPLFLIPLILFGQVGAVFRFSGMAILWLSIAGVLHFVWGRYCNYRASKAIGTNLQGPASQSDILFTLALAVWILGEKLTPLRVIGIILVICGPMITIFAELREAKARRAEAGVKSATGFQPALIEGYVFAVLSGTGYGISPIFVRLGLRDTGVDSGLAGGLVSYIAATIAISIVMLIVPGQIAHVRATEPGNRKWFYASGVTVMMSQMFRYLALSVAPVSVVQPIQRLSLIFRFFFSWWMNPGHEVFGGRVWLSTMVSLLGALALTISVDQIRAVLPLPDGIAAMLSTPWP